MVGWFGGVGSLWLVGLEGLVRYGWLVWRGWFVMVGWFGGVGSLWLVCFGGVGSLWLVGWFCSYLIG